MTDAVIFIAALLTLVIATLTALYGVVRNAPRQSQRQSYRRHRPGGVKVHCARRIAAHIAQAG